MIKLEYIWDWEAFISPDEEDEAFTKVPNEVLKQQWMDILKKHGIDHPKFIASFQTTQEGRIELRKWLNENIPHGYKPPHGNSIVLDNEKDLLLIKMVWG